MKDINLVFAFCVIGFCFAFGGYIFQSPKVVLWGAIFFGMAAGIKFLEPGHEGVPAAIVIFCIAMLVSIFGAILQVGKNRSGK